MDGHLFLKGQLSKSLKWTKKYPKGSVGRFFPTKSGRAVRKPNKKGRILVKLTFFNDLLYCSKQFFRVFVVQKVNKFLYRVI